MTRLTSFVVPTLKNDLPSAVALLDEALERLDGRFELIFVDDSPPEHLAKEREKLARTAGRAEVRIVDGPHAGKGAPVRRGVLESRGSVVFTMDADLPIRSSTSGSSCGSWTTVQIS